MRSSRAEKRVGENSLEFPERSGRQIQRICVRYEPGKLVEENQETFQNEVADKSIKDFSTKKFLKFPEELKYNEEELIRFSETKNIFKQDNENTDSQFKEINEQIEHPIESTHSFYNFCYLYIKKSIQDFYTQLKKIEKYFFTILF